MFFGTQEFTPQTGPRTVQQILQGAGAWQIDTPRYEIIGRNSPHYMHLMRSKTHIFRHVKWKQYCLHRKSNCGCATASTYATVLVSKYGDTLLPAIDLRSVAH